MSLSVPYSPRITPAQREFAAKLAGARARMSASASALEMRHAAMAAERERREQEEKSRIEIEREREGKRRKVAEEMLAASKHIEVRNAVRRIKNVRSRLTNFGQGTAGALSTAKLMSAANRVAAAYNVEVSEVLGWGRCGVLPTARAHLSVILCIENPKATILQVARTVGRDHTTVLHHIASYNSHFDTNIRSCALKKARKTGLRFVEIGSFLDDAPLLALMEGRAPATPSSMIGCGA